MPESDYAKGFRFGWEEAIKASSTKLDGMAGFLRRHKEPFVASHYEHAARAVRRTDVPSPYREADGLTERGA